MNTKTTTAEAAMAMRPWRMELAPSEGPTVRSSSTVTGAGSAPARSTTASSRASSAVKWPVISAGRAEAGGLRDPSARGRVVQLELKGGRLADGRLRALGILQAGQLDEDPIGPLSRDRRLGHAELVDAVADRLHALPHGQVPDAV